MFAFRSSAFVDSGQYLANKRLLLLFTVGLAMWRVCAFCVTYSSIVRIHKTVSSSFSFFFPFFIYSLSLSLFLQYLFLMFLRWRFFSLSDFALSQCILNVSSLSRGRADYSFVLEVETMFSCLLRILEQETNLNAQNKRHSDDLKFVAHRIWKDNLALIRLSDLYGFCRWNGEIRKTTRTYA